MEKSVGNKNNSADIALNTLIDALEIAVRTSTFQSARIGSFDASRFADLFEAQKWGIHGAFSMAGIEVRTSDEAICELVEKLKPVLARFLQPGSNRIGNGLLFLVGGNTSMALPTVTEYARLLVRAAAQLGSGYVTELMFGWVSGDPFCYRRNFLLDGISIDQPVEIEDGVRLFKLPRSFDRFPVSFPPIRDTISDERRRNFLEGVVLSIDCYMFPAIFRPEEGETLTFDTVEKFSHTNASGIVPGFSVDSFCEALSKHRNRRVSCNFGWEDLRELRAFSDNSGSSSWHTESAPVARKLFTRSAIKAAVESLFPKSGRIGKKRSIDIAMNRWIRAKRTSSTLDTLIELRIAFEALYDTGTNTEKSFRVATYAAWHVGECASERQEYFTVVKALYDDASSVIHASGPKKTLKDPTLIAQALDICRRGIVKRNEGTDPVNWEKLTMGVHEAADCST